MTFKPGDKVKYKSMFGGISYGIVMSEEEIKKHVKGRWNNAEDLFWVHWLDDGQPATCNASQCVLMPKSHLPEFL